MKTKSLLALCAVALLGVCLVACDDDETTPSVATGTMEVYYQDAPANMTAMRIRFTDLAIFNTAGGRVNLLQDANTAPVDLVAAANDPTLLASFNIPVGDYNGIEGEIDVIDFTLDTGLTCLPPEDLETLAIPRINVEGGFLRVTETGAVELLIDVPILSGTCEAEGTRGTLGFGSVTIGPLL